VPVFTKKENATLEQCIEVLDWYHANGKNQTQTAKHFNEIYPNVMIKQPLISSWIKNEDKWQEEWASSEAGSWTAKCARQTQHPEITQMMDQWVSEMMSNNILLTGKVLRQKWTRFANLAGIPEDDCLTLSDGWLTWFKTRCGLKEVKCHGKAGSVSLDTAERERECIQELIKACGVELWDIFNADETGFFYA